MKLQRWKTIVGCGHGAQPLSFDIEKSTVYGNSIESFIEFLTDFDGTIYFHNLKFDGGFIVDWLLRNGYTWIAGRKLQPKEFTTLISDTGQWYSISINVERESSGLTRSIKILDSLKILPMSIEAMPKAFGIPLKKLDLDYESDREPGHILTQHEIDYITNDVHILARALAFMYEQNMKKLTTGANAMNWYKKDIGLKQFDKWFPKLTPVEDADIRKAYKGGFTYLNPAYKNKDIGDGSVYDINSMYPWAMRYKPLPYGQPVYFPGEYEPNGMYPLYVQCLICEFKLKPGRIPSIQIKNNWRYSETEYLTESNGPTVLYLTSVDLELMKHNYDVTNVEYKGGYMFKARSDMFTNYIDYWYNAKTVARQEGNKGIERLSKLMLNSLYGKFGTNPKGRSKMPYLNKEKNCVSYMITPEEDRKGGYLPVACFITAWCRDNIIRSAEKCGDRFVYADTDSLHITGTEPPDIDIDNSRLGAFKLEETFERARFIRQKTYMEQVDGKLDVKCAGMPQRIKDGITILDANGNEIRQEVNFDTFYEGAEFDGKLLPKIVPGGIVLKSTTFKIKKAPGLDIDLQMC